MNTQLIVTHNKSEGGLNSGKMPLPAVTKVTMKKKEKACTTKAKKTVKDTTKASESQTSKNSTKNCK